MKLPPNTQKRLVSGAGGGGGKGGGGSRGRAPVEAPNTLRSRATARVVDLIGEGEIGGLIDGAKSIFFDDTQLQNDDGTFNFTGVEWAERTGTPSQDYLPGFPDIQNTAIVGVELINANTEETPDDKVTNASPVVHSFVADGDTEVNVGILFPNGLSQPGGSGNTATSVSYAIDIQEDGGGYTEVLAETISQLTMASIFKSYTFPISGTNIDLRVRRVTADTGPQIIDDIHFFSYWYTSSPQPTRTITNTDINAARVTVRLPGGLFEQATSTGDINPASVQVAVDLKENGGVFKEVVRDTISGKTTTPYEKAYRIELAEGTGPWDIKVRRVTSSDQGINFTNNVNWLNYTEIVDSRLRYPDSALIGIAVDAEAFGGSVPNRGFEIAGRIIQVPSNYDPETRQYTGVWDGTFQLAVTDNPAWCFYDMVMNTRYGLGEFITENGLKWDLYEIAQYCDELIPDGKGGTEPRYTFNGGFQTANEAIRVIQAMASVFRGMVYWGSGSIHAVADKPADPVKLVAPANTIQGNMEIRGTALKARHTVALVQYNDPDDGYRLNIEVVEDQSAIERFGWRPAEVVAVGCTSQGQAARVGRWLLDTEINSTQAITYSASFDHADVSPGDIISVADPAYSGVRMGGRIAAVADDGGSPPLYETIVLDSEVTLEPGEDYFLTVTLPDGTLATSEVANAPETTDTLTMTTPFATAPLVNGMYVLAGGVEARPFRVEAVKETDKHIFEIAGIFHDVTKYDRIELGYKVTPPIYSQIITGPILPPTDIAISEYLFLSGGVGARSAVTVSWQAPKDPRIQFYEISTRGEGTEWQQKAVTQSISSDLLDFGSGIFDFRVRALDGAGKPSVWVYEYNVSILGLFAAPDDVANFQISVLGDNATLTWDPISDLNLSHYIVKFSPETGATWQSSTVLLDNITTNSVQVPALQGTYLIKAQTIQQIRSSNASLILNGVTNFNELNVVETLAEHPSFAGVKDGVLVNSDFDGLQLDYGADFFGPDDFYENEEFFLQDVGFESSGTYFFGTTVDLGEVVTSRLTAIVEAFGVNFTADVFAASDFFNPDDFFRVESDQWQVKIRFRATDDDPAGSPVNWGVWQDFIIGDYTARGYQFQAILSTTEFGVTPIVPRLEVTVDMPDRIISAENITVPVAGKRIDFLPPYISLKGVSVAAQGLLTGDYYEITNKDEFGFDVIFKDSGGSPVERTLDYVSVGYGSVQ
jgi:predicted phage tail protein